MADHRYSGVPGELRGLETLHTSHGLLPWKALFQPAIDLALNGFRVGEDMVRYMNHSSGPFNFLVDDPIWAESFAPNGTILQLGDIIYRRRYANFLETISTEGPDALYHGKLANDTVRAVQSSGGILTLDDLARYKSIIRKPLSIDYGPFKIWSTPAPSSGAVVLSILKVLMGYRHVANAITKAHRMVETFKFGYGQRAELGDPEFVPNMDELQHRMLSDRYAGQQRALIQDEHVQGLKAYDPPGLESLDDHGTSHIVAVDSNGLSISLTTTINTYFGSQVMVPETGMICAYSDSIF